MSAVQPPATNSERVPETGSLWVSTRYLRDFGASKGINGHEETSKLFGAAADRIDWLERKVIEVQEQLIESNNERLMALAARSETETIDVDAAFWQQIKDAAKKSPWMPANYMMNDWVSDVCTMLNGGGVTVSTPSATPPCTEPDRARCPRLCQDFCNEAETRRAKDREPHDDDPSPYDLSDQRHPANRRKR